MTPRPTYSSTPEICLYVANTQRMPRGPGRRTSGCLSWPAPSETFGCLLGAAWTRGDATLDPPPSVSSRLLLTGGVRGITHDLI